MTPIPTAAIADACARLSIALNVAPSGLRAVHPGAAICGPARTVAHYGSVDVFLEAIDASAPGDVLVIDNAGRLDEACIGDLLVMEARDAGLQGIVVWGAHRDTTCCANWACRCSATVLCPTDRSHSGLVRRSRPR